MNLSIQKKANCLFDKSLIRKEILYKSLDINIKKVHIGFFPTRGRYFRKEMEYRGDGCFELMVDLPKGKSFLHYFLNENFENPINNDLSIISQYDPHKRSPLILETEVFCPIQFENKSNFISHIKDDIWEVRAITHQNWIESVSLLTDIGEFSLEKSFQYKNKSFWSTRIYLNKDEINYCIKFFNKYQNRYLHRDYTIEKDICPENFFTYSLPKQNTRNIMDTPLNGGYQIFPDRFKKGAIHKTNRKLKEWGGEPEHYSFFGGDLRGIISELDYLAKLHVGFIYLNPIFLSQNYHRYDCTDYMVIDPLLGNESDFQELVSKVHQRGMKLILDISLNHCSTDFFAFQDLYEKQEKSAYKDWFEVEQFPLYSNKGHHYSSWHGYKELPQFNLLNDEVQNYLLKVTSFWTEKFDIDGWRLDVCTEMPEEFINKFVKKTKKIKPKTVIIGESWQSDVSLFSDKCKIDGVTNFSLYLDALVPFFVQESISVNMLISKILEVNSKNSFLINQHSWNFLGNHDLPRFYSVIKDKNKYPLAYVLLYSLPGTPVIYYGEEINLQGLEDPSNRGCMDFSSSGEQDSNIKELISNLNLMRANYEEIFAFGSISFPYIKSTEGLLIIQRTFKKKHLFFVLNFGNQSQEFELTSSISYYENSLQPKSFKVIFWDEASFQYINVITGHKTGSNGL